MLEGPTCSTRPAPQVLDLLGRGVKDEAAARTLGLV